MHTPVPAAQPGQHYKQASAVGSVRSANPASRHRRALTVLHHCRTCRRSFVAHKITCSNALLPLGAAQMKDEAAARQTWQQVVALDRTNGHACYALGIAEQQEGHWEAAEAWYRRGCDSKGGPDGRGGAGRGRLSLEATAACLMPHAPAATPDQLPAASAIDAAAPDWAASAAACLSQPDAPPPSGCPLPPPQTPRVRCCATKAWPSCWPSRTRCGLLSRDCNQLPHRALLWLGRCPCDCSIALLDVNRRPACGQLACISCAHAHP